jgi:hypothetical protein
MSPSPDPRLAPEAQLAAIALLCRMLEVDEAWVRELAERARREDGRPS